MKVLNENLIFQLAMFVVALAWAAFSGPIKEPGATDAVAIGFIVSIVREWAGGWKSASVGEPLVLTAIGVIATTTLWVVSSGHQMEGVIFRMYLVSAALIGIGISGFLIWAVKVKNSK